MKIITRTEGKKNNFRDVPNLTQSLPKEDYLYERKGPWPQPSPEHPLGEAPAVVHLPKSEKRSWFWHIGIRYLKDMFTYWPSALYYAIKNKGVKEVSDETFDNYLTIEAYSKFLIPHIDGEKAKIFDDFLKEDQGAKWYILDLSLMQYVKPYEGMYACKTVVLIKQEKGRKTAKAIYLEPNEGEDAVVLDPNDGNAWALAKSFVLQGATYKLVLSEHALLHFPFDSINAISKTALPKNSILLQLLLPHLDYTLALDNAVLTSPTSPLENKEYLPYSGFVGEPDGLRELVVAAYKGIEGNSYYKPYEWTLEPRKIYSPYGEFLDIYYKKFVDYVEKVVDCIPDEEYRHIKLWAKYIQQWFPNFPDEEEIEDTTKLVKAVSKIMWDVSIAHAADHYSYSELPSEELPLRIRIKPPSSEMIGDVDFKEGMTVLDLFKYRMERKIFFKPTNVSYLKNVRYNFKETGYDKKVISYLESLNDIFLKSLIEADQSIKANDTIKRYIPLSEISRSIQY